MTMLPEALRLDDMIAEQPGEQEIAGGVGEVAIELLGGDRRQVVGRTFRAVVDEDVELAAKSEGLGEALSSDAGSM